MNGVVPVAIDKGVTTQERRNECFVDSFLSSGLTPSFQSSGLGTKKKAKSYNNNRKRINEK